MPPFYRAPFIATDLLSPVKKVVVTYGKLLSLSDMGLDKEECGPHDIKDAANKVMGSIFDLWEASAQ